MVDGSTVGLWGGLIGAGIGVAGGLFGTWCTLRASRGPRERAFLVRAAWGFWIGTLSFVALMVLLDTPHRHWLWIPYAPLLVWGVNTTNRGQAQRRAEDAAARGDAGGPGGMTPAAPRTGAP